VIILAGSTTADSATPASYRGAASAKSRLQLRSEKGDFVGAGRRWRYASRRDSLTVTGDRKLVKVDLFGDPDFWHIEIAPPPHGALRRGTYRGARRWPFNDNHPGLDASGMGRGCNELNGRFRIKRISFFGDGRLQSIDFTFVQHCEHEKPTLRGHVVRKRRG
jgi:hypothetical protein